MSEIVEKTKKIVRRDNVATKEPNDMKHNVDHRKDGNNERPNAERSSERFNNRSNTERSSSERSSERFNNRSNTERSSDRSDNERPRTERSNERPNTERPSSERSSDRSDNERPRTDRSNNERPNTERSSERFNNRSNTERSSDRSDNERPRTERFSDRSDNERPRTERSSDRFDNERPNTERSSERSDSERDVNQSQDSSSSDMRRPQSEKGRFDRSKDGNNGRNDRNSFSRNRPNDNWVDRPKRDNLRNEQPLIDAPSEKKPRMNLDESANHAGLKMVALAGAEEIGMNMTVYSYEYENGQKANILVDCGVAFENLPGAGVVMPDVRKLKELGLKIDAIILTHGHEDHIGAIPYLYDFLKVPMYATPFTCGLIAKKMSYIKKKDYQLEMVQLGDTRKVGPFTIKWIAAAHSIPDNSMLAIEVEGIRVFHTGDWKLDPDPIIGRVIDHESIIAFGDKGVHALVSDSTNIHEAETANSEGDVAASLVRLVKGTTSGRFVLTCFSSNVARVKSCMDAARAAGRKVLLLGTSLKKSTEVASDLGYLDDDVLVDEDEANSLAPEKLMIVSTGSQGEMNSALWKMANKLRTAGSVLERGDTLVFSARVIDGKQNDVRTIINQLVERGIRVMHPWNSKASCIHASGHPGKPDIAQLLKWVRPNYVIPVHSEAEHRISHIAFAKEQGYKAFNLRNGMVVKIGQDVISKVGTMMCDRLAYDGNRLVDLTSEIFKQRKSMNDNGMIVISVGLKNKKPTCILTNYGVYDKDSDIKRGLALSKQLRFDIERMLGAFSVSDFTHQDSMIKKKISEVARNTIWNQIKKNPLIACHIVG